MTTGSSGQAAVSWLRAFLGTRLTRLAQARQSGDLGASAIELAIITAVLVMAAALVVGVIYTVVQSQANNIKSQSNTIP